MPASQSGVFSLQQFTDAGAPLVGGRLYTYANGTTTQKTAYTDAAGSIPHVYTPDGLGGQYLALDARGELPAPLYLTTGAYDIALKRADGSTVWTRRADGIATATDLATTTGSTLIGWLRSTFGAVATTLAKWLERQPASVFEFMTDAQIADVQAGTYLLDVTTPIKNAIAASLSVFFPDGSYKITDELLLRGKQTITLTAGVTIKQHTANKNIFKGTSLDNVWIHCNGGVLYGEGTWSNAWTGQGGHEDRGIQFIGCTRSGAVRPTIKNCGHSGIAIIGGSGIKLICPTIEGTHAYSTVLPSGANYQNGIYITDHVTYGRADDVVIVTPDISGVAQGILRENQGSVDLAGTTLTISSPNIHDIPGQHAFYIQGGNTAVSSPTLTNIELAGFKVQSADANQNIKGFTCTGVSAYNVKSNLFEIATIGTGSISNVILSAAGDTIGTGIAINGKVKNLKADLQFTTCTAYAVYMFGAATQDIDITVSANVCGLDGVLITSTNATGIKIRPTLRNCNNGSSVGGISGVRVSSVSANVELIDPDVTDSNTRMSYGLFSSVVGSDVKVRGSAKFTGASDTAVRATGAISEFPTEATLSGTNGPFTSLQNVRSSQPMVFTGTTSSAANAVLWTQSLDDNATYKIEVELSSNRVGTSDRKVVKLTGCFFRFASGIATVQGATVETAPIVSAGFVGVHTLASDGANSVVLNVNSGGVQTYRWTARVSVTKAA